MLLRKERRKGQGERRRGWAAKGGRSGVSLGCAGPNPLPDSRPASHSQSRASPPPPCPGAFLGNPTSRCMRSEGILANSLRAQGASEPPAWASALTAAQTRMDTPIPAGSSWSRRGIPGTPPVRPSHIHTHTRTARGRTRPPATARRAARALKPPLLTSESVRLSAWLSGAAGGGTELRE
ncbi:uncharacterized protein LOC116563604 [Sapajus apella]|uniref:Uncharacterized protein LOC116563604 n=1 Tax=Sapajus apella TaxID=9515 RepID=A0A6J3JCN8_SAPAP|nr:uncharacterized protein LOC116563604 [Sapajus apella]